MLSGDFIPFAVLYHALEHRHCAIEAVGLAGFPEYVKGVLCLDQRLQELQVQREEVMVLNCHFPGRTVVLWNGTSFLYHQNLKRE